MRSKIRESDEPNEPSKKVGSGCFFPSRQGQSGVKKMKKKGRLPGGDDTCHNQEGKKTLGPDLNGKTTAGQAGTTFVKRRKGERVENENDEKGKWDRSSIPNLSEAGKDKKREEKKKWGRRNNGGRVLLWNCLLG